MATPGSYRKKGRKAIKSDKKAGKKLVKAGVISRKENRKGVKQYKKAVRSAVKRANRKNK